MKNPEMRYTWGDLRRLQRQKAKWWRYMKGVSGEADIERAARRIAQLNEEIYKVRLQLWELAIPEREKRI